MPISPEWLPFSETRHALGEQLGGIDGVLPGSLVVRYLPCGKANCACKADPPHLHGPYVQWSRSVGGKTVTRYLSEEQLTRFQPWFDNAKRLRDLVAKLEITSIAAFDVATDLDEQPGSSGRPRARRPRQPRK